MRHIDKRKINASTSEKVYQQLPDHPPLDTILCSRRMFHYNRDREGYRNRHSHNGSDKDNYSDSDNGYDNDSDEYGSDNDRDSKNQSDNDRNSANGSDNGSDSANGSENGSDRETDNSNDNDVRKPIHKYSDDKSYKNGVASLNRDDLGVI